MHTQQTSYSLHNGTRLLLAEPLVHTHVCSLHSLNLCLILDSFQHLDGRHLIDEFSLGQTHRHTYNSPPPLLLPPFTTTSCTSCVVVCDSHTYVRTGVRIYHSHSGVKHHLTFGTTLVRAWLELLLIYTGQEEERGGERRTWHKHVIATWCRVVAVQPTALVDHTDTSKSSHNMYYLLQNAIPSLFAQEVRSITTWAKTRHIQYHNQVIICEDPHTK